MKSNRRGKSGRKTTTRLWTLKKARTAVPYIRSVLGSLREHHLEARLQHGRAKQLADLPGRPNRDLLIEHQEAVKAAAAADERYQQALAELEPLRIKVLDPVRGFALLPFLHDDRLAWFVFDLIDPDHLRSWRYHRDPPTRLRPLSELDKIDTRLA